MTNNKQRSQQTAPTARDKGSTPDRGVVTKPVVEKPLTAAQIRQIVRESDRDHQGSYDYLRDK